MVIEEYFYRELLSANFVKSLEKKKLIPVRVKNKYNKNNEFFSEEENKWITLDDSQTFEKLDGLAVEFAESPIEPGTLSFSDSDFIIKDIVTKKYRAPLLEELEPKQMQKVLDHRELVKRYAFAKKNLKDSAGIQKDFVAARVLSDTETLTLKITFYKFDRIRREENIPCLVEKSLIFDIKNGSADLISDWPDYSDDVYIKNGIYYEDYSSYNPEKKGKKTFKRRNL